MTAKGKNNLPFTRLVSIYRISLLFVASPGLSDPSLDRYLPALVSGHQSLLGQRHADDLETVSTKEMICHYLNFA